MTRALLCPGCDTERSTTIAFCPSCKTVTESYSYELTEREEFAAQRALEAERFTRAVPHLVHGYAFIDAEAA